MSNETAKHNEKPADAALTASLGSRPIRVKVYTGRILVEHDIYPEREVEWVPARFHIWAKSYHCPAGDGSMEREMTLAIVEMQDGSVQYYEPHNIRFENTEPTPREPVSNANPKP